MNNDKALLIGIFIVLFMLVVALPSTLYYWESQKSPYQKCLNICETTTFFYDVQAKQICIDNCSKVACEVVMENKNG